MNARSLRLEVILSAIDRATRPMKALRDESSKLARTLKASRDQLKDLTGQQKQVDALRKLQEENKRTGMEMRNAKVYAEVLGRQLAATANPTREMRQQFQQADRAARKLSEQHAAQTAKLLELRRAMNAAGVTNLTAHETRLRSQVEATTQALEAQEAAMARLNKRAQQMHAARARYDKTMQLRNQLAGTGAGMLATGVAAGATVLAPIKDFAAAENSAIRLKAAMMDASGAVPATYAAINDLAVQLGNRLPGTTSDFQDMMTMLMRQGMTAENVLGGVGKATAYLGVQLQLPVDEVAQFAAKMKVATSTADKDMMGLMDMIQRTAGMGIDHSQMMMAFSNLAPAMDTIRQKGLEGAKALAPLVVMGIRAGLAGESAGNAYQKIFRLSLDAAKVAKANKALSGRGVRLDFSNGKGEFGGLENMYAQLDKLKGMNTQARNKIVEQIFGNDSETMRALSPMINQGIAGYREVERTIAGQASLQKRVDEQLGSLENIWDASSGNFTNARVKIGATIAPEVKKLVEWLGKAAETLANWVSRHPVLTSIILKTVAVVAMLATGLGVLAIAAAGILGPLAIARLSFAFLSGEGNGLIGTLLRFAGRVVPFLLGALRGLAMFFLTNPIGIAIAVIGTAAYVIYRYWTPIKAFFSGLWSDIQAIWDAARGAFTNAIVAFCQAGKGYFLGLWSDIKSAFNGGLVGILALLANWSPLGLFYKAFAGVLSWFGIELPGKFSEFGGMLMHGLVNGITNGLAAVKNAIGNAADSTVGWFKEKLGIHSPSRVFAQLGGYTMAGLERGLAGGAAGPLSAVRDVARRVTAAGAGMALGAATALPAIASPVPIDARPPIATPRANAVPAPVKIHYEINVHAAPGMDAHALARAVAAELDRRERAGAARTRSRLADND